MDLKQMKIIAIAMIKYLCLQDFIRPVPVKNLNHKSSASNFPGSLLTAPRGCQL